MIQIFRKAKLIIAYLAKYAMIEKTGKENYEIDNRKNALYRY